MARNKTKDIAIDGSSISVGQLRLGQYIDLMTELGTVKDDVSKLCEIQARYLSIAAVGGQEQCSKEGLLTLYSWPEVRAAFQEMLRFSSEDIPEDDSGKVPSP